MYDLIIVGAGPAGLAAALSARIDHLALMMAGLERWGELWQR